MYQIGRLLHDADQRRPPDFIRNVLITTTHWVVESIHHLDPFLAVPAFRVPRLQIACRSEQKRCNPQPRHYTYATTLQRRTGPWVVPPVAHGFIRRGAVPSSVWVPFSFGVSLLGRFPLITATGEAVVRLFHSLELLCCPLFVTIGVKIRMPLERVLPERRLQLVLCGGRGHPQHSMRV